MTTIEKLEQKRQETLKEEQRAEKRLQSAYKRRNQLRAQEMDIRDAIHRERVKAQIGNLIALRLGLRLPEKLGTDLRLLSVHRTKATVENSEAVKWSVPIHWIKADVNDDVQFCPCLPT